MDVSIAVSLIRGQMGAVVERAVNGAVETVLSEMLKVVGVKFEELKAQVALMKRDITTLQREKTLKEKENENIRAKLRYTELKLKYYRQGVEEELQQRASASALVRIHPAFFPQSQKVDTSLISSPSCLTQMRGAEEILMRSNQECDIAPSNDAELVEDCEWTATLQTNTEGFDTTLVPAAVQSVTLEPDKQFSTALLSSDGSIQADSSALPSPTPQVKQEVPLQQQDEEVIYIKEEPEEQQQVMGNLLLNCQLQQEHLPGSEAQMSLSDSRFHSTQKNLPVHTSNLSSTGPSSYLTPQPSVAASQSGVLPRQATRPWSKDLSLYEEYKLRRNELRRRSLNRRRELEKTLPQPLLADLVRERREKTRLRVAKWRAKRKLQACLDQVQAQGGGAVLSDHPGFPISGQHEQPRVVSGCSSSNQQLPPAHSSANSAFLPSSTSLLLRGSVTAPASQHTMTSAAAAAFPQQTATVMDVHNVQ
ncbi:uncharacterized protein si:ch211-67e16.4 [Thalassophryne amazonica]|uniref:uncharacterized protein si:ch211-67e16.4 n=1 Tax=Thalassophryne amazonica TaxID=390379 RepID=UPI001470BA0C|nr:uncharacterized protein si:ch211-67e16.4 [Thalassophryne amazonica]